MQRRHLVFILTLALVSATSAMAADDKADPVESVASCSLENGTEIAIRYHPVTAKGKSEEFGNSIKYGTVWTPNNQAMVLFTSGPAAVENKELAAGAYTLYMIPNKSDWTLVVSKETDTKAKYDAAKDVVRVPMELGTLPTNHPNFEVILGKAGPNHCALRVYWQTKGAFAGIDAK